MSDNAPGPEPLRVGTSKFVTIAEPEDISPRETTFSMDHDGNQRSQSPNQSLKKSRSANLGKRLSGRLSIDQPKFSLTGRSGANQDQTPVTDSPAAMETPNDVRTSPQDRHRRSHNSRTNDKMVEQIRLWLHEERAKLSEKRASRTSRVHHHHLRRHKSHDPSHSGKATLRASPPLSPSPDHSDTESSLNKLEKILTAVSITSSKTPKSPVMSAKDGSYFPRKRSSVSSRFMRNRLSTGGSSDTDYVDGDALVPHIEAYLDNSKTMGFGGGAADSTADTGALSKKQLKEREEWIIFKNEIVRLSHTLKLKGWRRVPLDAGAQIEVARLSGALTNAVYVVSPPKKMPQTPNGTGASPSVVPRKPPPKLLLRVYGPQTAELIDRESELQVLRRLARKKIGPRLLGTFENGRFEQFFYAKTLTAKDLRNAETSKQIAKRMRELHEGIELLQEEREAGPFVWQNWDKWVARCEKVTEWLDENVREFQKSNGERPSKTDEWKARGFVCGTDWATFRKAVEKYREWLETEYGGREKEFDKLVFAHNDTQYGNLLRLEPSGESPLMLPANEHKQLVVIDFEYANANLPGLEFANHFTEWCYNYHSPNHAYVCDTTRYPNPAEQTRFLKAYVVHRPNFNNLNSANTTPVVRPTLPASNTSTSSITSFNLDSYRTPPNSSYAEEETQANKVVEEEVRRLMWETRLWRVANSAQWVAWGIVQAKVEGLEENLDGEKDDDNREESKAQKQDIGAQKDEEGTAENAAQTEEVRDKRPEGLVAEALEQGNEMDHDADDEGAFDYLAYAQERALFFWGDVIGMGLVEPGVLDEQMSKRIKRVDY